MSNKIATHQKTRRVCAAIDALIIKKTEQLCTFVKLKQSLNARMVRGQLLESDLDMVRSALRKIHK